MKDSLNYRRKGKDPLFDRFFKPVIRSLKGEQNMLQSSGFYSGANDSYLTASYNIPILYSGTPHFPYLYRQLLPVNPTLFMSSAKNMQILMKDASTLLARMATSRKFSLDLMRKFIGLCLLGRRCDRFTMLYAREEYDAVVFSCSPRMVCVPRLDNGRHIVLCETHFG